MMDFEKGVEFDPGYSGSLIAFLPAIEQIEYELNLVKNFNQKKMKFKMFHPMAKRALNSTLGFWVGCILWAAFIRYRCEGAVILGNNFAQLSVADLKDFEYIQEFESIEGYIKNYSKNMHYYLGLKEDLPENYLKIVADYKQFLELNEYFINVKTTADIKLPTSYEYFKTYSATQLDELLLKIEEIIAAKDLSKFLFL